MNKKRFADFVFLFTGSAILLITVLIMTVNLYKDGRFFEKPVIAAAEDSVDIPDPQAAVGSKTEIVQPDQGNKTQVYRRTYETARPSPSGTKSETAPIDYGEGIPPKVDYGEGIPPGMSGETPKPTGTSEASPKPSGTPTPTTTNGAGKEASPKPTGTSNGTVTGSPKPTGTNDGAAGSPKPSPTVENTPKAEKIKVDVINYSGIANLAESVRAKLEAAGYEVSAGNGASNKAVKTEIIERNDKKAGAGVKGIVGFGAVSKQADPNSRFDVTVILGDDFPR